MATPPRPKQRPKDLVQRYINTINSLPEDELLFRTIVREAEGEGELGMALVAKAIFNRKKIIDSGTPVSEFNAKDETIKGILLGDGQFQPVTGDYRAAEDLTEKQRNNAIKAIELAKNNTMLKSKLEEKKFSSDQINNFLNVTGFRGLKAKEDKSQDVNKIVFKKHVFNTAGNKDLNIENLESFEGTTSREDGRKAVPLPMMKPEREDSREAVPMPMMKPMQTLSEQTDEMLEEEDKMLEEGDDPLSDAMGPRLITQQTSGIDLSSDEDTPTGDSIFTEFFSSLGDVSDEDEVFEADELNLKEGGSVEEVDFVKEKSEKNDPPPGATPEEVADDIPAMLSEGEYVLPANVVKYIGLERIMDMHRGVLREIQQMEDLGMIQNVDENGKPEDDDKEMTFLEPEEGVMQETIIIAGKPKDGMMCPPKLNEGAAINRNVDIGDLRENIASERSPEGFTTTYDPSVGIIKIKTPSGNITLDDTIINYNQDPDQSGDQGDPGDPDQGAGSFGSEKEAKEAMDKSIKDIVDQFSLDFNEFMGGADSDAGPDTVGGGHSVGGSDAEAAGDDTGPDEGSAAAGAEAAGAAKGGLMQRKGYANGGSVNYNIAGVGQVGGNLTQGAMNEMAEALPKPKTYDEIRGDIQGFNFPDLNTASTDPDSENYYGRKLQGDLFKQRQEKADLVHRPDQGRDNAYNNDQELQVLLRRAGVDSEDFRFVMDEYKTGGNDLLGQGPSTLNEQLKNGLDALTDKRRMLRDGIKSDDIPEGATNRDMLKKIFFNELDDFGAELDYDNYQANDKITGIINQDPDNFSPNATEEYKAAIKSYDLDGPADIQKLGYASSMLDSDRGASAIPVKEDKGSGIMGERRYVEGVGYVEAA